MRAHSSFMTMRAHSSTMRSPANRSPNAPEAKTSSSKGAGIPVPEESRVIHGITDEEQLKPFYVR